MEGDRCCDGDENLAATGLENGALVVSSHFVDSSAIFVFSGNASVKWETWK
jgi:hypothetical protein